MPSKKLNIVVPVLNEADYLVTHFKKQLSIFNSLNSEKFNIIFTDNGSQDNSVALLKEMTTNKYTIIAEKNNIQSIARSVNIALKKLKPTSDYVLILPIDCTINAEALAKVHSVVRSNKWGGLNKTYTHTNWFIQIYLWLQNNFRSSILKNVVWTNGLFFPLDLLEKNNYLIEENTFLEDIILCDYLKKNHASQFIFLKNYKIIVNSRKYLKEFPIRQILKNLIILSLYRFKLKSIQELKKLY